MAPSDLGATLLPTEHGKNVFSVVLSISFFTSADGMGTDQDAIRCFSWKARQQRCFPSQPLQGRGQATPQANEDGVPDGRVTSAGCHFYQSVYGSER